MAGEWSVLHSICLFFFLNYTCVALRKLSDQTQGLSTAVNKRKTVSLRHFWGWDRRAARWPLVTTSRDILPFVLHRWRAISLNLFRSAQEQQSCVLCDWTSRGSWRVDGGEGSGATMIQLFRTTKTTKGRVDYYFLCHARRSQSQKKSHHSVLNPASPQDCVLFWNIVCFSCCDKAGSAIIIILILWWYFLFYWTFSC